MRTNRSNSTNWNLEKLREKLAGTSGPQIWRSLDELAETEEFQEFVQQEFPQDTATWTDPLGRRRFLQLMGASIAFAGLTACTRQPEERLVPFVTAPEQLIPGKPQFYASAMPLCGYGQGILVESHDGRPTKIEGNPNHPASLGATTVFAQASLLELYDPDRAQVVTSAGRVRTWEDFRAALSTEMERLRLVRGRGLRILTGTVTSPTEANLIKLLLKELPEAGWHQYEPLGLHNQLEGSRLAFGRYLDNCYRFDKARVVLSLDADFTYHGPGSVRYSKDLAAARRENGEGFQPSRLYMVESSPTVTGTLADHRLTVRQAEIESVVRVLARELGIDAILPPRIGPEAEEWARAVARDLASNRGAGIIIAGEYLPAPVHALVHLINQTLENHGKTVFQIEPVSSQPTNSLDSVKTLASDLESGKVETLVMFGGNPVFDAPIDLNFGALLQMAGLRVHLSSRFNETSELSNWHIPESHFLEAWGDVKAFDGTISIIQPLIEPLHRSKSAGEVLAVMAGNSSVTTSYEIVRQFWQEQTDTGDFEKWWRRSVHDGLVRDSAGIPRSIPVDTESVVSAQMTGERSAASGYELILRPDPSILDGRFVNNGWLQELPKPLTKLTWDNAALISPATAAEISVGSGRVVELEYGGRKVLAPVWIQPGHPSGSVTLHFGYGSTQAGKVGQDRGFNAYPFRTTDAPSGGPGLTLSPTQQEYPLACTQNHSSMHGRNLAREVDLVELTANPHIVHAMDHDSGEEADLYSPWDYTGHAWGMAVDLNSCTGCNACVVACQAENNISVVGKDQVLNGREMHWIRIDRYFKGPIDNPDTLHQPVMCQQCETAPCESVCPVAATNHSDEGLNDMVYNRCVGTRYCSNNCPYKVRRFNFLLYSDWQTETLKLQRNPNVTVRSRGVMEKCTYCVQRINRARIQAKLDDRTLGDGDIKTACQQVCPTDAIVFGDINDPNSHVSKLKQSNRNYALLKEFNTKPRTTYLAKVRNRNEEMVDEEKQS